MSCTLMDSGAACAIPAQAADVRQAMTMTPLRDIAISTVASVDCLQPRRADHMLRITLSQCTIAAQSMCGGALMAMLFMRPRSPRDYQDERNRRQRSVRSIPVAAVTAR